VQAIRALRKHTATVCSLQEIHEPVPARKAVAADPPEVPLPTGA
jgi:hypothetical protein